MKRAHQLHLRDRLRPQAQETRPSVSSPATAPVVQVSAWDTAALGRGTAAASLPGSTRTLLVRDLAALGYLTGTVGVVTAPPSVVTVQLREVVKI